MTEDLYPVLVEIRDSVGLYAVMTPENLKNELSLRGVERAESVSMVMGEAHDLFVTTRTKPRLNELKNLAGLIAQFLHLDSRWTLGVLNDFNDCIFRDQACGCAGF